MKAARTRSDPDFARNTMAVDDDLAAVIKLDLKNAVSRGFKIEIRGFQRLLDVRQRCVCGQVEVGLA